MKKISTEELITGELENYLDGVLSCFDFNDGNLGQYVTGRALELLEKLPERERAYAISRVISSPDYDCINGFPYPQSDNEFFLAPTEFMIDLTRVKLENPEDFCITEAYGDKCAFYAMDYGALIALDLDRLEEYVTDYLKETNA